MPSRNWELPLNGGTPYDSNVELDPSADTRGSIIILLLLLHELLIDMY